MCVCGRWACDELVVGSLPSSFSLSLSFGQRKRLLLQKHRPRDPASSVLETRRVRLPPCEVASHLAASSILWWRRHTFCSALCATDTVMCFGGRPSWNVTSGGGPRRTRRGKRNCVNYFRFLLSRFGKVPATWVRQSARSPRRLMRISVHVLKPFKIMLKIVFIVSRRQCVKQSNRLFK